MGINNEKNMGKYGRWIPHEVFNEKKTWKMNT